jgi:hypothetical protein
MDYSRVVGYSEVGAVCGRWNGLLSGLIGSYSEFVSGTVAVAPHVRRVPGYRFRRVADWCGTLWRSAGGGGGEYQVLANLAHTQDPIFSPRRQGLETRKTWGRMVCGLCGYPGDHHVQKAAFSSQPGSASASFLALGCVGYRGAHATRPRVCPAARSCMPAFALAPII